jgi:hypothetical protein
VNGGIATVRDSVFTGNNTNWIGGAFSNGGQATIEGSQFYRNAADPAGGAIANEGTLMLRHSSITDNEATFLAGGLFVLPTSVTTLVNTVISGNRLADPGMPRTWSDVYVYAGASFTEIPKTTVAVTP